MHASKISEKDIKKADMNKAYALMFATTLVTSYILAHFIDYLEATTISGAFLAAFWIWLGFYVTTAMSSVLWEGKSWTVYAINIAHYFISLAVMAIILALWA